MTIKTKSITIGIIALFIGLAFIPMGSSSIIDNEENKLPVEISFYDNNGVKITEIIELSVNEIKTIEELINELQNIEDEKQLEDKVEEFIIQLSRTGISYMNLDWLDNLPGNPIFSFGKGPKYLTRYHGRVQVKKVASMWIYPSGFGTTVIWGNGFAMPPTQILLKRQMGLMVGFVGLYLHIPPLIKGMTSRTCFFGSTMFSWGVSL
jgi:hypothetical protein